MTRRRLSAQDRALGLGRAITRRDFLQGAAIGGAGLLGASLLPARGVQDPAAPYPPALTGLRGSQPGSFEAAHALRDAAPIGAGTPLDEHYDLVVAGAGISGLSAAHFSCRRGRGRACCCSTTTTTSAGMRGATNSRSAGASR